MHVWYTLNEYDNLKSFFYLFGILENNQTWWSWDKTVALAEQYNLAVVPVVFRGSCTVAEIKSMMNKLIEAEQTWAR